MVLRFVLEFSPDRAERRAREREEPKRNLYTLNMREVDRFERLASIVYAAPSARAAAGVSLPREDDKISLRNSPYERY